MFPEHKPIHPPGALAELNGRRYFWSSGAIDGLPVI
jgi:hypothetical protein